MKDIATEIALLKAKGFSKQEIYEILISLQMQEQELLERARKARTYLMN